jgi:glucosamine--fructose-6-phosphate aminotransferase (isomerizing)
MTEKGVYTFSEIISQPAVWEHTLAAFRAQSAGVLRLWQLRRPARVMFTGCGSTYYLAIAAADLFQFLTAVPALARPASEMVLFPELVFAPHADTLLVAISRSGATTETLDAVKLFQSRGSGPVLVISCDGDSPLAAQADASLLASAAQEESVAQTRSFSSMAVLAEALAAALAGQTAETVLAGLPVLCERLLTDYRDLGRELGNSSEIDRFFFLGSGFLYGIACEAMLKMKEMSLSYSEAYHFLEFRHGPMSMVTEQTLIIGLLSEGAQVHEEAVLRQMHQRGAHILALSEGGSGLEASGRVHDVVLHSGLPGWARTILYLPVLHLLAYYRAIANDQNPDHPAHLNAVVSLDSLLSH